MESRLGHKSASRTRSPFRANFRLADDHRAVPEPLGNDFCIAGYPTGFFPPHRAVRPPAMSKEWTSGVLTCSGRNPTPSIRAGIRRKTGKSRSNLSGQPTLGGFEVPRMGL